MDSLPQIHHSHRPLHLSLNHRRPSSPTTLFSSISFRPLRFPSFSSSSPLQLSLSIRASSSPSPKNPHFQNPKNTLIRLIQTLIPIFSSLIEPICVATAAASLFYMRLQLKPTVTVTPAAPPPETTTELLTSDDDEELTDDTEALKSVVEVKIGEGKIDEAIRALNHLIELEPDELEWPMLKAQMYVYKGEHELALNGFEDVLEKDRFRVDALHGLMTATFELNKPTDDLLNRIDEAVKFYKIEKKDSEVRELKLLIAQVKVIEEDFDGAVKVYEDIEKEEPKDFRPYLCQGIVYTMLRRKDEAEEQFEKFRKLVPEDHPYKEYFEDNTMAFSLKLAREGAATKR